MEHTGADIRFNDVCVTYPNGFTGLKNINLSIPAGEMVGIVGLSGAGKSTLVRTINGLVPITSGSITVGEHQLNGRGTTQLRGRDLRELRSNVGMVFQSFNLAKRTTVINNVLMGRLYHSCVAHLARCLEERRRRTRHGGLGTGRDSAQGL